MYSYIRTLGYFGGLLCIATAAAGFFLLKFLPPSVHIAWILPLVALLAGFILILRLHGLQHAFYLTVFVYLLVWSTSYFIWPRSPSLTVAANSSSEAGTLLKVDVQIPAKFRTGIFTQNKSLLVPEGTKVNVFRAGLRGVRWITFSPTGELFASLPNSGQVVKLIDDDRDGYAEMLSVVASGLDRPHGLVFDDNDLLVAGETTLYRVRNAAINAPNDVVVISRDIPGRGGHWTRSIILDTEKNIYLSAGSSCNACEEKDPRRATIRSYSPQGGDGKLFASGLRNSVGLAYHPVTGDLWASENGRDMLGDDLPPDEINLIRSGSDYGWPFCYGENVPDPDYKDNSRCAEAEPARVSLQAHSAPLGILFAHDLVAPQEIRNSLLVAYHGSWNRSVPTGYKIVSIPFVDGLPAKQPVDMISGWLQDGKAWGRPVALASGPAGNLYVSDDRADAIYRFAFDRPERRP